jgi:hypothetical protein
LKEPVAGPDGGEKGVAGENMVKFYTPNNSHPIRFAKEFRLKILAAAILRRRTPSRSGVFENQDAAIIERDFGSFPC